MPKYAPLLFLIATGIYLCSCMNKKSDAPDTQTGKIEMMKADRAFSQLSETKGMKAAFLEYIDSNGVLLRPDMLPVAGADAIDFLIASNDTGYIMKWQPKDGMVAASGELGYTYGFYEIKPALKDTLLYGSYVNIWKKQKDGKWKLVLDTGNEGIGE